MRSRFDEQLALLNKELIKMGSLCEEAITIVSKALTTGNVSLARRVASLEEEITQMEHTIETSCLKLLLQQQPVARDLRQISAALKMITDMERIGVQANDISEIITYLNGRTGTECEALALMADATITMVTESVDAYVNKDVNMANDVIVRDDIVDSCFDSVKNSLIHMIAENPKDGEYAIDLLMISKYLERIGDHAVNIAEWVVFSVTGVHKGANEQ